MLGVAPSVSQEALRSTGPIRPPVEEQTDAPPARARQRAPQPRLEERGPAELVAYREGVRKREIRFAVGERGDQLSPVWKIWNRKDDVYLTARMSGAFFKISLHRSGVWTVAATQESGIEAKPGNRRMKAWQRPPEFQAGWTWGPHIAVARLPLYDHGKFAEKVAKIVEWIPKPEPNFKATIAVIFAPPEKTLDDLAQICTTGDAYINDYLELKNRQKVFIRIRYEPLTEDDAPTVGYLQSQAGQWIAVNDDLQACLAIFMQAPPIPWVYVLKFATPPES